MTDLIPTAALPAASARPIRSGRGRLRRLGAPLLAAAVALSLAACGPTGPGADTEPGETSDGVAATDGATTAASECADVEAAIAATQARLNALPDKIPGDLPGAITDVQTSIDEVTTLSERVQDGELKQHLENVTARGTEALTILEQAQAGEITLIEAGAQGMTKLGELQSDLSALSDYCGGGE
ncbi:hypothetical protein GCM10011490_27880 [Pseudoclavibacter endophyticus]|uniref:Uncharacterized protein n=1 Tax=Pseudoclavibacter endophyticus TaxID=1778590 RepID=A0A6H9WNW7_9MICO|nr:hypothetical protein [Pseudoclavibacter endophyticus]KAB1646789.1 hypothetical protein F8O04_13705 [Pseudoclavibacter endophyticus]GGA75528.1 hypothetical protein GCM10011490_27880 [Pseudoclavibacter endophyticus]